MEHLKQGRNRSYVYYHELTAEDKTTYKHEPTHLRISVQYHEGGINYFSGGTNPRGYRVSQHPVSKGDNGMESSIMLGDRRESGYYVMVEQVKRYNANRLLYHAEKLDKVMLELARAFIAEDKEAIFTLLGINQPVMVA